MPVVPTIKLSICITTFNRAAFIGSTLQSIVAQLESNCEVVIVDGASSDNTEQVVSGYVSTSPQVRYLRQPTNQGIDRDYDRTVQLARGEYCWLMTDDDLLEPRAIVKVLAALRGDPSLVLVNYRRFDNSMSEVLLSRFLEIDSDLRYGPDELDRLFSDTLSLLVYIGCVVIRRTIWIERDRERYYDSMMMHVGVIFQKRLPADTVVIAHPLINYRDGNARTFWPKMFEIFLVRMPALVASLDISERARREYLQSCRRAPLLWYRAMGWYGWNDYRRWILPNLSSIRSRVLPCLIALAPGTLVNALYVLTQLARSGRFRDVAILHLRMSPFYLPNRWRARSG